MTDKRKNIPALIFTALFFLLCVFFSLGMLLPGARDAADSGDMPSLVVDGKISETYRDDFEDWFSKHFAYRDVLVDAFSVLKEKVFRTGNDQVIVGRDGFLFLADTVEDYAGANPMTAEELAAAADSLKNLQDYAQTHGADFLFVCAPNKNTVYGEKMPASVPARAEETDVSNLTRLHILLDERGVNYVDLRPVLQEAKLQGAKKERLIYHKRDSHWNNEGARIAAKTILEAAGRTPPAFLETPLTATTHDFRGDLDSLLYPKKPRYDDEYVFALEDGYRYLAGASSLMSLDIRTSATVGRTPAGSLLVFRDSFGNALIPYFASLAGDARFSRPLPYRIDYLEEETPADLVVVEIAERNLRNLIGSDGRIAERDAD